MKYVTPTQIGEIIASLTHGRFFSLFFRRVQPKCPNCGRKDTKWIDTKPVLCPHCGTPISYEREAICQTGVHNPKDKSIAPKGVGETFAEKREKGLIGFYDSKTMGYRTCRLENILKLKCDGEEYVPIR